MPALSSPAPALYDRSVLVSPAHSRSFFLCNAFPHRYCLSSAERADARAKSASNRRFEDNTQLLIALNAQGHFIVKNSACCARLCMLDGPRISLSFSLRAVPFAYTNPAQDTKLLHKWAQRAGFMWWSEHKEWWIDTTGFDTTTDMRLGNLVLAIPPSFNIKSVQDLERGRFYPASIVRWAELAASV